MVPLAQPLEESRRTALDSRTTFYITLVGISGVFHLFLWFYVFSRRKAHPSLMPFVFYTAVIAVYCFGYAFELASETIGQVKLWSRIEYIGIATFSPLALLLIRNYLGFKTSRFGHVLLFVIPAVTWVLVATSDYHHLFYKVFRYKPGAEERVLEIEIGYWYIVNSVYALCCTIAGVMLVLARWRQTRRAYRLQLAVLICGQLIPMAAGISYMTGLTPVGIDPVPMSMTLTSALYITAIVSTRMLTVIPIAKETIFDSMGEGFIVLDAEEQLIDYNRTAAEMIPPLTGMIGQKLDAAWQGLTGRPFPLSGSSEQTVDELTWAADGAEQVYEVRASRVRQRNGEPAGSLLMLIRVTELKRLQRELEHQAYFDGLTQIYNRLQFIRRGRALLQRAQEEGTPFSVLLFDIDAFKRVNDTYGHDTGDRLIVHVVEACRPLLAADMLFARYGGEEFAIATPGCALPAATGLAERLRAALEASGLPLGRDTLAVSASFGVAQAAVGQADERLETLLSQADQALYTAKREGRNRVRSYG